MGRPADFAVDPETWREHARALSAAASSLATVVAGYRAVEDGAGPAPDERRGRWKAYEDAEGALTAAGEACSKIADAADTAQERIGTAQRGWDDVGRIATPGSGQDVARMRTGYEGDADLALSDYETAITAHLATLTTVVTDLAGRGVVPDPLDPCFASSPAPEGPGDRVRADLAVERFENGQRADPIHVEEIGRALIDPGAVGVRDWEPWAKDRGYTSADVQAALAALSPPRRSRIQGALADLDPAEVMSLASFLWTHATADQIGWLHEEVPALEPAPQADDVTGEPRWTTTGSDLTQGEFGAGALRQGALGDCWLMVSLAGVAEVDPDLLRRNVQKNPNGTYTVTLYPDGPDDPVDVTVSGYLPVDESGGVLYGRGADDRPNWASIYEKAAAALPRNGSYDAIDGRHVLKFLTGQAGWPKPGIKLITGKGTSTIIHLLRYPPTHAPGGMSAIPPVDMAGLLRDDIAHALDEGRPVMASTGLVVPSSPKGLRARHSYVVVAVDGDEVTVRNPWNNPTKPSGAEFTIAYGEYFSIFLSTDIGNDPS